MRFWRSSRWGGKGRRGMVRFIFERKGAGAVNVLVRFIAVVVMVFASGMVCMAAVTVCFSGVSRSERTENNE